jgi:hypothetical protein
MRMMSLENSDTSVHHLISLVKEGELLILTQNGQPQYMLGGIDEFEWEVFSLSQKFMDYLA